MNDEFCFIMMQSQRQPPQAYSKKGVLNFAKFTGKILQVCNFLKKEPPTQGFYRKFCKILKNAFFTERLQTAASGVQNFDKLNMKREIILTSVSSFMFGVGFLRC